MISTTVRPGSGSSSVPQKASKRWRTSGSSTFW
jgi:hypothetical protein